MKDSPEAYTSSNSVLFLIDHQVGTMKLIKTLPLEVAKRNTLALAKAAKVLGIIFRQRPHA